MNAIIAITVVGFILVALFSLLRLVIGSHKRRQQLDGLAASMDLKFSPVADASLLSELKGFHLIRSGEHRKIENCLSGTVNEIDVAIFQFRYSSGGSSPSTYHHAVAYLKRPMNLPDFRLHPRHIFHKIGNLFGLKHIEFTTHPTFSKNWQLNGDDEIAIRKTLTPQCLSFCENLTKLNIEGKDQRLLIYRNGFLKPKDVPELLRIVIQLGELLKKVD